MKKNNFKIIGLIFSICFCLTLLGVAYAYFEYYKTGEEEIVFNGGKIDVLFTSKTGSNVSLSGLYPMSDEEGLENGLEYEFSLTGYNESEENMHYRIYMDNSSNLEGKTRFLDSDIKVAVFKNGQLVLEPSVIENYSNPGVYFDAIPKGSSSTSPVTDNYVIKVWIADHVRITDTSCQDGYTCYRQSDYPNMYFNKIVKVEADFSYDALGYISYNANGGSFTPSKTSVSTQKITLQKPVMEGKGFLGWSSDPLSTEVEYKAGDTYTGTGEILYAIYSDTRNVMVDLLSFPEELGQLFTSVYESQQMLNIAFVNDTKENIAIRSNVLGVNWDLTLNNQGKVTAWIESLDENETPVLYIGSEGTTYLSSGQYLFGLSTAQTIDLTNVDTSMVTNMNGMFGSIVFEGEQITTGPMFLENIDLSGFNTSQVTDMSNMFSGCMALTELNVSGFNTSNVLNMSGMFFGCMALTELDVSGFNTSNVSDMSIMFAACSGLSIIDLSNFNTSKVTNMSMMFASDLLGGYPSNIEKIDLSNFDTSNVTDMSAMFFFNLKLEKIDVSHFDTSKVTNMSGMFAACEALEALDVSNFNTSNVEDMSYMFGYDAPGRHLDRISFGLKNVLELDVSNFDTSNVRSMEGMFAGCKKLTFIDVSNFDTSKVENMANMFSDCYEVVSLDIGKFNTSNVNNMSGLFHGCRSLITLDLSNFDTSDVADMSSMFAACSATFDISNFKTSNVTSMFEMFYGCIQFSLLDLSHFDTSKVQNMEGMFYNCDNLISLDISNFDTSQVTTMNRMFMLCGNLEILDLSSFNTLNLVSSSDMFRSCTKLKTIYSNSNWASNKLITNIYMFYDCNSLIGAVPYNSSKVDVTMANPDTGYFTRKS